MRFTVFTPTYNRGYVIDRLYRSLCRQSFKDFEWIVVNDGSTDNTDELFNLYKKDNKLKLKYFKVENGGKHRAINIGVNNAEGELFFIVDSDDYLTDDALDYIDQLEKTIEKEDRIFFAGVCPLIGYRNGSIVGKTFEGEALDITTLEREKNGIYGDKAEVFYTELLKRYPFPEYKNEKFVTECVVWDRIAFDGYKLRFSNRIVYLCEYLPDGLSANYNNNLINNPHGWGTYISQLVQFGQLYGINKWNTYLNYYYSERGSLSFWKISRYLSLNPIKFFFRLHFLRFFRKFEKMVKKRYKNN